jgi:hypothetical protein
MQKLPKIILVINLLLLNVVVSYLVLTSFAESKLEDGMPNFQKSLTVRPETKLQESGCKDECKAYIDKTISQSLSRINASITPTPMVTPTLISQKKTKKVSYIPIPGSGETTQTGWTAISGTDFYVSKADFPGLSAVFFEVNIKLVNGNGSAFVRLYDISHSIAVVGSELSTSSQTSTFVSVGPLSLWEGYNHYRVQAKSLTADTTVFESGRLKVVTEE